MTAPSGIPPFKILIVCDRLLTGFDAPVEQVMYLDKPLRDHNLSTSHRGPARRWEWRPSSL
jgi:hypothetical protein